MDTLHLKGKAASVYVPDQLPVAEALRRTTRLCVGAHQDDQEFMAYDGIVACYGRNDQWFSGVTVTNGGGSSRTGYYAETTDHEMMEIRRLEQDKAAFVGGYAAQVQLGYPSSLVKDPSCKDTVDDLEQIFEMCHPDILYLHNPADKHDTHIAVFLRCLEALRRMPVSARPSKVYGCEIWRSLDWLLDEEKVPLATDARPNLAAALAGVFDSQIAGGKRYDLAVQGRRLANATFYASHAVDDASSMAWALDLTALVHDDKLDPVQYTLGFIDRFRADVKDRMHKFGM